MDSESDFAEIVLIPSSSGGRTHQVTCIRGKLFACDCEGYRFRHHCRHLGQAKFYLVLRALNEKDA